VKTIHGADLFCGAGGTSTAMLRAAVELDKDLDLIAVNHWQVAINSHTLNHPNVRHKCENLESVKPRQQVPSGRLRIMAASPECTDHSNAAGGKPKNDQRRAGAWHVHSWATQLTVDDIFIENVREWEDWGPLLENGITYKGKYYRKDTPDPRKRGVYFKAFKLALEALGYRVEYRFQRAMDFGDPTSRTRLIMIARRGGKEIRWPDVTHGPGLKPYRTARECIDWSIPGKSIFNRPKPLSPNTIRRIEAGIRKFCGEYAQAFLIKLYGTNDAASLDEAMPTITAGGNHLGLVQPFLIPYHSGTGREDKRSHSIDEPLRTLDTQNRFALVNPFLVGVTHSKRADNVHSVEKSFPTITTAKGGEYAVVQPWLMHLNHGGGDARRCHSIDGQVPTLTSARELSLLQPFLIKYNGTGTAVSIDDPMDTITSKDRFGLVNFEGNDYLIDITLRMLQVHELQLAMSFPRSYHFYGTQEDAVKQIGNAVPVELATAHMVTLLSE